jgi:hypothetical protein
MTSVTPLSLYIWIKRRVILMINYAPIINTSVPGFLIEDATTAKKLKVYFTHNIAVSKAEVKAISVIIKPYSQLAETNYIA